MRRAGEESDLFKKLCPSRPHFCLHHTEAPSVLRLDVFAVQQQLMEEADYEASKYAADCIGNCTSSSLKTLWLILASSAGSCPLGAWRASGR